MNSIVSISLMPHSDVNKRCLWGLKFRVSLEDKIFATSQEIKKSQKQGYMSSIEVPYKAPDKIFSV